MESEKENLNFVRWYILFKNFMLEKYYELNYVYDKM